MRPYDVSYRKRKQPGYNNGVAVLGILVLLLVMTALAFLAFSFPNSAGPTVTTPVVTNGGTLAPVTP